jgi:hypothetical protein
MNSAHSAIRKDGIKAPGMGFVNLQNADVHPGSYDVKARLALMDEQKIQAQIAYPNALGFGGQKAMMVDADLRLLSTSRRRPHSRACRARELAPAYPAAGARPTLKAARPSSTPILPSRRLRFSASHVRAPSAPLAPVRELPRAGAMVAKGSEA